MLPYVLYELTLFDRADTKNDAALKRTQIDLCWMLEALVQRNMDYLKHHPETPRLYRSGVKYQLPAQFHGECDEVRVLREALGRSANKRDVAKVLEKVQGVLGGERFRDIGRVLENGGGDCDNLACWRAAELRQMGIPASAYMMISRQHAGGGTTYHAIVLWPPFGNVRYKTHEDPSLLLGMGGEGRAADRQKEIEKNRERGDIIRKYGVAPVGQTPANLEEEIENVLGLRARPPQQAVREMEEILRGIT